MFQDPASEEAVTRQSITRSTYDALDARTRGIENFPVFLEECFENRIWEKARTLAAGGKIEPISFHDFVHMPYPVGLGATYAKIEAVIVGNEKLAAMWKGVAGRDVPELGPKIDLVNVDDVVIGDERRTVRDVTALVASIGEVGLLQPIVVTDGLRLVAGRHRLEAFRKMGRPTIPARIVSLSEIDAQLAEIDENLARNELTALERSEQLARRKALYEAKHPETKHGALGGGRSGKGTRTKTELAESATSVTSFSEDTSAKTGLSARTVRQDVQIANDLAPDVKEAIRDLPIANRKTELLGLAKKPVEEQREVVESIKRGDRESTVRPDPKLHVVDPVREAARALAKVPHHRLAELVAAMSEQTIRAMLVCIRDRVGAAS